MLTTLHCFYCIKDGKACRKKKKSRKLGGFYLKRRSHLAKYGFFSFVTNLKKDDRKMFFPASQKPEIFGIVFLIQIMLCFTDESVE